MAKIRFSSCIFSALIALIVGCGPDLDLKPVSSKNAPSEITAAEYDLAVCPASDKTPDKLSIDVSKDADAPYVDVNREVKDFGTDFVVREFFKSEETLFNFMKLVYTTIDQELKNYRSAHRLDDRAVFLIFKGGNVLRIVANQVLGMLPPEAKAFLEQAYEGIFKRSDADFSVLVDPKRLKGLDYNRTMTELINRTYNALNDIRAEFAKNPKKYFSFWQLAVEPASLELKQYFDKLGDLESVANPDNPNWYQAQFSQLQLVGGRANKRLKCRYEGQYDYRYEYDPKNENQIIGIPISKKPHWIMNTINRTLEWPVAGHPEKIVKFDLVRAKVQFEYTYMKDNEPHRKPIGGELIDVSFPNRIDFRLTNFLKNYPQWIATYRLTLKETGESLIMKAESVAGLSADIYEIMFGQFDRPWGDPKYQKRLNRLFFLSIVDMLSTIGLGSKDANEYANSVQQQVVDPLKNLFPLDGQSTAKAKEVSRAAQNIMKKYPQMGVTNKILWGTVKLVFDEMIKNPGDDDEEKFKEYLELIQKNLDIIKKLAEMPPQTIDARQIYNASMSSFF